MSKEIFSSESGALERSLTVNDDGTLTYYESNSGWRMMRRGSETKNQTYTVEGAKARWPSYADKIDEALSEITSG